MFINPRLRFVARHFAVITNTSSHTKKLSYKAQFKRFAVLLGLTGLSVGVGNVIYDYIVLKNLEQIDASIRAGFCWDPEWDSYELLDDSDMLVQPAIDDSLKSKRKRWETEQCINRRLILMVRHGTVQKHNDKIELSNTGQREMVLTSERIASIVAQTGGKVRVVVHSSSQEATSSAEIIAARLGVALEPTTLLDEGFPELPDPAVSALTPDMIVPEETARLESGFRTYFDRPQSLSNKPPRVLYNKSKRSIKSDSDDADTDEERVGIDVLVGHGNQTRYFLCRALQLPSSYWLRFMLSPASVTAIEVSKEGRVQACMVGDCGHIQLLKENSRDEHDS